MITCHVFGELPGVHKSWTLAVMAVSLHDAREYVRLVHKGGKLIYSPAPGSTVNASCGATTKKAQAELREKNQREQEEFDAAWKRCKRDNPDADEARLYLLVGLYL
jgi:hypothetical protein